MKRAYDHNWQQIRLVVLERDAFQCQVRLPGCQREADAVDHIIPLSEGGARLDPHNLRAACRPCNSARMAGRQQALVDALSATLDTVPSRRW